MAPEKRQMHYIFIINGRKDKAFIRPDVERQVRETGISHEIYMTTWTGDATRFVRLYCEFHEKEETCFVACGGSGIMNEVASALVGAGSNKSMAFLAYGTSNDLTKSFPKRDFRSVRDMLDGAVTKMDIIRCNDDYILNVGCVGFDSMSAYYANRYIESGNARGYRLGILKALIGHRFNRFKVTADGKKIHRGLTLQCTFANAQYYGNQFKCAPEARTDDGLIDICLIRACSLVSFLRLMGDYTAGTHINCKLGQKYVIYRKARHVEIESRRLLIANLDGEVTASSRLVLDVIDKGITFVLPATREEAV